MGEPVNGKAAQKEFNEVVEGIKDTTLEDGEEDPLSRRPSRPHHSAASDRPEHPLSRTPTETETEASTVGDEFPLERCLFCNYRSPTWKLSVAHMEKFHGMFIPERTYLADEEGLIRYLADKITEDHECLYCHTLKGTLAGVQTHMRDKGHCMIAFETEDDQIEIGQFYDFSSTYSDDEDEEDEDGVKLPSGDDDEDDDDEEGDGWETDSSASSLDSDELSAVPIDDRSHQYAKLSSHKHHSHDDPRAHKSADGFHSHAHNHNNAVFHSDIELTLPSGRTAGHRSLNKYYRQNLHSYPTPEERAERQLALENGDADAMDVDGESSNNNTPRGRGREVAVRGQMGMLGTTDAQKKEVKAAEKRTRKIENRARRDHEWVVNKRGNNQKHFRVSFTTFISMSCETILMMTNRILSCNDRFCPKSSLMQLRFRFLVPSGCISIGALLWVF